MNHAHRFAFNNPNYWSDPTGLFETKSAAMAHISQYGLSGATVSFNEDRGIWEIDNRGYSFWMTGDRLNITYISESGNVIHSFNVGGGGGSNSGSGFAGGADFGGAGSFGHTNFGGFTASEIGTMATAGGGFAGALNDRATINATKVYNYGTKTIHRDILTAQNKARMTKIASRAKIAGTGLAIVGGLATIYDGATNGWQNHHTADLAISGALYVLAASNPLGWVVGGLYFVADMTTQYYTGKSITENLFD